MLRNYIHQLLRFFYPLVKKIMPFQVYAYLVVGACNTFLNIALFAVLYLAFKDTMLAVEAATVISFLVTVLTGFWLNKNFAFSETGGTTKEVKRQFGKYAIVALQGQFSAYLLTKGIILLLSLDASLAYGITSVIMITVNYFLQKYYTFRNRKVIMKQSFCKYADPLHH